MKRREFIHGSFLASLAAGLSSGIPHLALGQACPVADLPRNLVNVMLQGGADLRFLFVPSPLHLNSNYVDAFWAARRGLYESEYNSYQEMFDNEYLLTTDPGGDFQFGIYKRCSWLHSEFEAGRVAVISNAHCSLNRKHDQSILNADAGEPSLKHLVFDRNGWGGRLAEAMDGQPNVVELGQSVSVFSKGSNSADRLEKVIHAENMRDMALSGVDTGVPAYHRRNVLARALHAWYNARGIEVPQEKPADWPYHAFFKHREVLQTFGISVQERINLCGELPNELQALLLNNEEFTQQCKNLFDACQMPDVLNMRVMSMNYGGWDTHDNEYLEIGNNLEDLFGADGGFATTLPQIETIPYLNRPAREQLVFYFASDFGRQLVANGSRGTDHGRGTYSLLMGNAVHGGVYGEMFPEMEIYPDTDDQIPLKTPGADIRGQTSTERILACACDWVQPGTSTTVFPGASASGIETPGLLDNLLDT